VSDTAESPDHPGLHRLPGRCQASTRDGSPCTAFPVRGEQLCAGHLGRGLAANPAAAAAQSATRRQEQARTRKKRPQEVYSEALLENAEEFARRLVEIGLRGEDAAALRAIEALNSRVLDRPKETVEQVKLPVPEELQAVRDMSREEREELWRRLHAVEEGLPA